MSKIIIYILFILAALLATFIFHLLVSSATYGVQERFLHCRYLLVYLILLVALYNRYSYTLELWLCKQGINSSILKSFWELVLPQRNYEISYLLLCLLASNILLIIITGVLFHLVHLVFIAQREFVEVSGRSIGYRLLHLPWNLAAPVYEENEDMDGPRWRLGSRGFTMGKWAKAMKFAFLLAYVLELAFLFYCTISNREDIVDPAIKIYKSLYMLPMAGYMLVEQIALFLEAELDAEAGSFGSESGREVLRSNFDFLQQLYLATFGDSGAFLGALKGEQLKRQRDGLAYNGLTNDQRNDCDNPEILDAIVNQLQAADVQMNLDYQNALIDLVDGRSVNIRDFIHGEILVYLAAYMNFYISLKKTFIIFVNDRNEIPELADLLERTLSRINRVYSIWNIGDIDAADSNKNLSILICTYDDFVTHRIVAKREDFIRGLRGVIFSDAMDFCAQGNIQKELVIAELRKIPHKPQYVVISEYDSDSLRNAFEYFTDDEIHFYKNDQIQDNIHIMLWKSESKYKIQRCIGIGRENAPYMGTSIPLALLGIRYSLPRVRIFSGSDMAYHTYAEVMERSTQEIDMYIGFKVNLPRMVQFNQFNLDENEAMETMVLYDSSYNLFNLIWSWMKYGGDMGTMFHVVSPPYMMREYFAANLADSILNANQFEPLVSYQSGLKQSHMFALLMDMCNAGIDEEELMKKSREYGWSYENSTQLLEDCLRISLGDNEVYNIYECFKFEETSYFDVENDCFRYPTIIKLSDENVRRRVEGYLEYAHLRTRHSGNLELPILRENLHNYYLPGYQFVYNGYRYLISKISDGMVFAEQENTADKKDYWQASEFCFYNVRTLSNCIDLENLDFDLCTADVDRTVYGYWETNSQISLSPRSEMQYHYMEDGLELHKKGVHILRMRLKKSFFNGKETQALRLLAFMTQELFKTLFPLNYQNLYAVMETSDVDVEYWKRLRDCASSCTDLELIQSMIPFYRRNCDPTDAKEDEYLSLYIVEYSEMELGMVNSLYNAREKVLTMMHDYLNWYLDGGQAAGKGQAAGSGQTKAEERDSSEESADGQENGSAEPDGDAEHTPEEAGTAQMEPIRPVYLNLGMDQIPDFFAAEELNAFIDSLLPKHTEQKPFVPPRLYENACSFCGKPGMTVYEMSDGRIMCPTCKQQQLNEREEIQELYLQTVALMEHGYNIRLRKNIHLRLHSAETIALRFNTKINPYSRVLGFYQPANHELWIENRGPRNAMQSTMIHELSHSWQFDNCDMRKFQRKLTENQRLIVLEGHTSYMEVDAMRKLGQKEYAQFLEDRLMERDDEYGIGYRLMKQFLDKKATEGSHWTPYMAVKYMIEHIDEFKFSK